MCAAKDNEEKNRFSQKMLRVDQFHWLIIVDTVPSVTNTCLYSNKISEVEVNNEVQIIRLQFDSYTAKYGSFSEHDIKCIWTFISESLRRARAQGTRLTHLTQIVPEMTTQPPKWPILCRVGR